MRIFLAGKRLLNRIPCPNRVEPYPNRSFCSAAGSNKPTTNGGGSSNGSPPPPPPPPTSLSTYDEQLKALEDLDFTKAAKIIFADTPKKKKFGLDFHLVQLVIVCLPSLAVYLVAQYARSEMRKMDAELEVKKQAEFEAQAKAMELKAAEEQALVASNPALLEVKERLDKLEETLKDIMISSQKPLGDAVKIGGENQTKQKQASRFEQDNTLNESGKSSTKGGGDSSEAKTSGLAPGTRT